MRALGVDLGSKRIGLALSDASGTLASPLTILQRSRSPRVDREAIARVVADEEVGTVVVGLPLALDGSVGPAARAALEEAERLATVVGVPVVTHDERLTSVTAERRMAELGMRSHQRRGRVDAAAAAVMLQSWLDARREQGAPWR
ncbi:MAG: Holliday junction resolvase RuvX [Ilumatobacteraceae bacterium]|jgi:putative Holliday junction resolvase|nr:Holliday junction resolvase RuvX [Ilumatobacteraceae bacterium]